MSDPKLGELITGEAERDAIHIAVAPVVAMERLQPGEHVGLVHPERDQVVGSGSVNKIGIVDPYLKRPVESGERFWLFLYPKTVTGMRHQWSHPAFTERKVDDSKVASEKWLHCFADRLNISYPMMMEAIGFRYSRPGPGYGFPSGAIQQAALDNDWNIADSEIEEMWKHWEVVTGNRAKSVFDSPFECSC